MSKKMNEILDEWHEQTREFTESETVLLSPDELELIRGYRFQKQFEEKTGRKQIDGYQAITFAVDRDCIDDHYDRLQFLQDVLESDMTTIAETWPEFAEFCKEHD